MPPSHGRISSMGCNTPTEGEETRLTAKRRTELNSAAKSQLGGTKAFSRRGETAQRLVETKEALDSPWAKQHSVVDADGEEGTLPPNWTRRMLSNLCGFLGAEVVLQKR